MASPTTVSQMLAVSCRRSWSATSMEVFPEDYSAVALSFAQPVATESFQFHPLKSLVEVQSRFGPAEEQVAVRAEHLPYPGENLLLGGRVEINQHVAE